MRGIQVGAGRQILAVRILAAISVALALMCAGLALAWKHEHEVAKCFEYVADQDRVPQDKECLEGR